MVQAGGEVAGSLHCHTPSCPCLVQQTGCTQRRCQSPLVAADPPVLLPMSFSPQPMMMLNGFPFVTKWCCTATLVISPLYNNLTKKKKKSASPILLFACLPRFVLCSFPTNILTFFYYHLLVCFRKLDVFLDGYLCTPFQYVAWFVAPCHNLRTALPVPALPPHRRLAVALPPKLLSCSRSDNVSPFNVNSGLQTLTYLQGAERQRRIGCHRRLQRGRVPEIGRLWTYPRMQEVGSGCWQGPVFHWEPPRLPLPSWMALVLAVVVL